MGLKLLKPSSGSHWLAKSADRSYPFSLHNGLKTELPDSYIRAMCRAFGLDEQELRKLL